MSTYPCISSFGYFDSPEFIIRALHILTTISTPIYFLGLYCILFKTPEVMKSVKLYMLNLHLWIMCLDYYACILTVPLLMVPELAGIPYGVLRYLGVPTLIQALFGVVVIVFMFIANIIIYENRFFILCEFRGKSTWAFARRIWLIGQHAVILVCLIPDYFLVPDQETAKQKVFQNLPCLPDYIYQGPVFVLALDLTYHLSAAIPNFTVFILELVFFISMLILNGKKQLESKTISQKTYQMHKQFLIALVTQMTIPLFSIMVPVAYGYLTVLLNYYNQALINWVVFIVMTHGALSTVVMIVVHKPYRLAVKEMIRGKENKVQRKATVLSVQL